MNGLVEALPGEGQGLFGKGAVVRAVDGVSFDVRKGETLGVVGESGCGKSTTARLLMQLIAQDRGELIFDGEKVGGGPRPLPPIAGRCRWCSRTAMPR